MGRGGRMMTKMAHCKVIKDSDGNDFLGAPLIHGLKCTLLQVFIFLL